jgi:hypothetical protein
VSGDYRIEWRQAMQLYAIRLPDGRLMGGNFFTTRAAAQEHLTAVLRAAEEVGGVSEPTIDAAMVYGHDAGIEDARSHYEPIIATLQAQLAAVTELLEQRTAALRDIAAGDIEHTENWCGMDACECDRVHAREALANTPPDVAQAMQWMAAGKRVMGGALTDDWMAAEILTAWDTTGELKDRDQWNLALHMAGYLLPAIRSALTREEA